MPLSGQTSNFFSIENSTTTPLLANGVFVGVWEDVSAYASIAFLWKVDQSGILFLDFSIDATQVDRSISIASIDLNDGNFVSVGPRGRFFRIRYVNGTTDQQLFRLQTSYSALPLDEGHAGVGYGIGSRTISVVTRSAMHGQMPSGTWGPVKLNSDGSIATNASSNALPILSPVLKTDKLVTSEVAEDQVIVSYTPTMPVYVSGFSAYVWDAMTSSQVVFGECSLESPAGTKLYTSQMSSMSGGKDIVNFGQSILFPSHQEIRLVCTPSGPITNQTWQGNLIMSA